MTSDAEDDDLAAAIALSLSSQADSCPTPATTTQGHLIDAGHRPTPEVQTTSGLAGLDRKAMEAERLARRNLKRQRSITPPGLSDARKVVVTERTITLPSGSLLRSFSTMIADEQKQRKPPIANSAMQSVRTAPKSPSRSQNGPPASTTPIQYPHGTIKKTWAFGHDRDGRDIKIEEVLEPATLKTAVLSAFDWDLEWVLAKLKTPEKGGKTKCVLVMHAKGEDTRSQYAEQVAPYSAFLRLCLPPMGNLVNCMHSKLMLLFHGSKLRVAIPTANLNSFDWGEKGTMENTVFIIDLPRYPDDAALPSVEDLPQFGRELLHFLDKQGMHEDVKSALLNFDFSATKDLAFVHTIGGTSFRKDAAHSGLTSLAQAIRYLKLQSDDLDIDFAASSIGTLNDTYLQHVHAAARGEDMLRRAQTLRSASTADFFKPASKKTSAMHPTEIRIRDKLRIYFPTHETVLASTAQTCGTVCLARKAWETRTFPQSCFRDYRSTRPGLLSHNKILLARGWRKGEANAEESAESEHQDRQSAVAWVYVGSANMSKSAWGEVVQDKRLKDWKVMARNWECGVVVPVRNIAAKVLTESPTARPNSPPRPEPQKADGNDSETDVESQGGDDSETEVDSEDEVGGDGHDRSARHEQREEKTTSLPSSRVSLEVFSGILDVPFEYPSSSYHGRHPWFFAEQNPS